MIILKTNAQKGEYIKGNAQWGDRIKPNDAQMGKMTNK